MNVLHYLRVSTDEQAEKGYSLQNQEKCLSRHSSQLGQIVLKVFSEDFTGKHFDRPAWNQLMQLIKSNRGKIDCILFLRWDRFSRDILDALNTIVMLKKLKVKVNAIQQPLDMDSPGYIRRLADYLSSAQEENEKISVRTLEGSRMARTEGCWTGTAPLGYTNCRIDGKSTLEPNELAPVVKNIFEDMATGIYSAEELWKRYRQQKSIRSSFSKQGFLNLLRNIVYTGKIFIAEYNGFPSEVVPGLHPPIVTEILFNRVQRNLERKPRSKIRELNEELYPLKSILQCPVHHIHLTASKSKSRNQLHYHYYHCSKNLCKHRHPVPDVHELMSDVLSSIQPKKEVIKLYERILQKTFSRIDIQRTQELKNKEKELFNLETQKSELYSLLLNKRIADVAFNDMWERIVHKIKELKIDLDILKDTESNYSRFSKRGFHMLSNLKKCYEGFNSESKRKILGSIFPEKLIFQNRTFRTTRINKFIGLISLEINGLEVEQKEKAGNFSDFFNDAPLSEININQVIEDLRVMYRLKPYFEKSR